MSTDPEIDIINKLSEVKVSIVELTKGLRPDSYKRIHLRDAFRMVTVAIETVEQAYQNEH